MHKLGNFSKTKIALLGKQMKQMKHVRLKSLNMKYLRKIVEYESIKVK